MAHRFSSRVTTAPDVMFSQVGEEAVLLNLKTELYLGLDQVGTRMWVVLNGSNSIQDAYESLLAEFDVEPARLREDLVEFMRKLMDQGLIEIGTALEQHL